MLNSNQLNEEINFSKYFRYIAFNAYRIIFIGILFVAIWLIYFLTATRIYELRSLIQVDGSSSNVGSYEQALLGGGDRISLDEQIYLYKSRSNQQIVVNELDLSVFIDGVVESLDEKKIMFDDIILPKGDESIQFTITVKDDETALIESDNNSETFSNILDNSIIYKGSMFKISSFKDEIVNQPIAITFINDEDAIKIFLNEIVLTKYVNNANFFNVPTLLSVSYRSDNIELGKEIINSSNEIFIKKGIERNVEEARKSLTYIKTQSNKVQSELNDAEIMLNDFKKSITSVDIELEVAGIVEESISLEKELNKIDLKEAEIRSIYTSSNPLLIQLQNQREEIKRQQDRLNALIESLPDTRQKYISLLRNVQINQVLYEDLLAKELEFSLIEASTLGNAYVIDEAFKGPRVSPRGFASLVFTIVLALIFGVMYALIRGRFFSRIQLPSDIIEELPDLKLIGVVSNSNLGDTEYKDSVDTLVTNVSLICDQNKRNEGAVILQVIGATKGVGKSTTSVNIAKTLASRNKKVIILDMDHRRGQLHAFFGVEKSSKDIFSQQDLNLEDFKVEEYLSVVPRPSRSSSKVFASIDSPLFRKFIENLRKEFDYIIFDTAPVLAVSDSLALSKYADHLMLVARHDESKTNDLYRVLVEFRTVGKNVDYLIYNSFQKPQGFYYYDYYAYKYYGNYDYGYKDNDE